jgi:hypothetical protein
MARVAATVQFKTMAPVLHVGGDGAQAGVGRIEMRTQAVSDRVWNNPAVLDLCYRAVVNVTA